MTTPQPAEAPSTVQAPPKRAFRDLRKRVVSAVAMLLAALACLFAGLIPFALLTLLIALVMSWEWGRVVRGHEHFDTAFMIHAAAVIAAVGLAALGAVAMAVIVAVIGAATIVPFTRSRHADLSAAGVLYCALPAVALIYLRADEPDGALAVLFLFALVWTNESIAFLAGRTFGGTRLWPSVSPNKTWTGFLAGLLASITTAVLFGIFVTSAGPLYMAITGLLLGIAANFGDLAESALKRGHGVKDTSDLIPGHGGVMDRMDGIVVVAIVAVFVALILDGSAPATALLRGPAL